MTTPTSFNQMTLPQQMLYVVGLMQIVMEGRPKADTQVRSAIHHWELAIQVERGESDKEPRRPNRD